MYTLYEVTTGSRAYGLQLEFSDYDVLLVVANGADEYLGITGYKDSRQFKNGKSDVTVYDVRFYGKLLCAGNPNAVLPLFFKSDVRSVVAPEFQDWLLCPRRFLSTRTVDSFRGMVYRQSQDFREDVENGMVLLKSWKAAANAMYMLSALKSLCCLGGLDMRPEKLQLFRDVKKGLLSTDTVLRELAVLESTTTKEFLTGHGSFVRTPEEVFEEVNREVRNTLKTCLQN